MSALPAASQEHISRQVVYHHVSNLLRRRCDRHKVGAPAEITRIRCGRTRVTQVQILDVSAAGIGVVSPEALLEDELFVVRLQMPSHPPMVVLYRARWCTPLTPEAFRLGGAFIEAHIQPSESEPLPGHWMELSQAMHAD